MGIIFSKEILVSEILKSDLALHVEKCMESTHLQRREISADFQAENAEKLKFDNNEKHHQQLVLKNKKRREAYVTEKISNHLQLKIVQFENLIRQVLNYEFCPIHQILQPRSSNLQPLDEINLIFGYDPQHLFYERSQMRKHLLNILRTKTLENFPSIYKKQEIAFNIHAYECCQLQSQQPANEDHENVHVDQINDEQQTGPKDADYFEITKEKYTNKKNKKKILYYDYQKEVYMQHKYVQIVLDKLYNLHDDQPDHENNRLKSQKIIKWVFYNKKKTINQLKWTFQVKCKNIVTVAFEKSQLIPKSNVERYVKALCGKSLHTHNSKQFPCNDTCRKKKYDPFISNGLKNCYLRIHESTLGTLSDLLDKLFTCTNPNRDERNGHSLKNHQLYEIRRLYTHLSRVDEALEQGDVAFLKKLAEDTQAKAISFTSAAVHSDIAEDKLTEDFKKTIELFEKRRSKPYVISHYIFKVKIEPENFNYSLVLLKQPWRWTDELLNGCETYQASFMIKKGDLPDAVPYFEKITNREIMLEQMAQNIEDEEQQQKNPQEKNNDIFEDLGCVPEEVENAMDDFQGNKKQEVEVNFDWQKGVESMNEDQRRVFDSVFQLVKDGNKICRKFVTGEAGTGKSYVIKCLVHAIRQELKKDVAILASTGIAAFNVGGLTMHRLLQLPVEHKRGTPKYSPLSDTALDAIRKALKNVVLDEDGWFAKMFSKNLLQLPPVSDGPVFVPVPTETLNKCVQSVAPVDLWFLLDYGITMNYE
ncbi:hypothetical protein AGLY_016999 [Aphis glycines]|uniref:ATP-dependent DNA helicase n=1 Tax=Aphis glycines TaxID=307491 RepID=A0A6G0SY44_APHGL|nr:hypothetical protein AGLY_016999 [Aphis glycines]